MVALGLAVVLVEGDVRILAKTHVRALAKVVALATVHLDVKVHVKGVVVVVAEV